MESVAEEILREILVRLPTRDVARCRCVSRQWRGLLTEPYFRDQHAHAPHVVSGAGAAAAEALLVSKTQKLGWSPKTSVFNVSTAATMCVIDDLAEGYSPANACNGFLLLSGNHYPRLPVFVCNTITGEKLQVPPPRRSETESDFDDHMYAMGYNPSTRQYKIFCLFFLASDRQFPYVKPDQLHVLTLGGADNGGWRRHEGRFRCHMMGSPPALIHNKLYLLGKKREDGWKPDRLLVVDVPSETHRTYCLPRYDAEVAVANVLELQGRLCVVVHELDVFRPRLCFWVVRPQALNGCLYLSPLIWDMRYSFSMNDDITSFHPRNPPSAWLDADDGMIYYLYGDRVYKYDTNKEHWRQGGRKGCRKAWDHQLRPSLSNDCEWSVFSGYRPNLLSPHDLAIDPHQDEERFEHGVLDALRCHKLLKKMLPLSPPIDEDNEPAAN